MNPKSRMVRLAHAISGLKQADFAAATGVHSGLLVRYETGEVKPGREKLEQMLKVAGLTVADGEELLEVIDTLRKRRVRAGQGKGGLALELAADLVSRAHPRLLRLPPATSSPAGEDRLQAAELWASLAPLSDKEALGVARLSPAFHSWALVELLCEESAVQASRDLAYAVTLSTLARHVAARVPGPAGWCRHVQAYAAAHSANILRVAGKLKESASLFDQAKRYWNAGSDPLTLLDPGRLLDLEASLCRDQRRFADSLALLKRARSLSRYPGRTLIKKAFTLVAMGEYWSAIETLLEARDLPDLQASPRLENILRVNLADIFSWVGRFEEAAELVREVRATTAQSCDEIALIRITWIEGRIAAGLGQTEQALQLLGEAREEFAARQMWYDVALALLEESALLLAPGRTAEVKERTRGLDAVFAAEGVHREALAALRLFHAAAEKEAATAELARGVLRFLFRARHDAGVPFAG